MTQRHEAHPSVAPLLVDRWSPRSFDGSEMPQGDLDVILEAAGWAPSAFNAQPWRFLYARRGDENWERFLGLLVEGNRRWAHAASVLVFIVSDTMQRRDGKATPSHTHSFDTGAAWENMALQATAMGYHAHGMIGVDLARAVKELGIPEDFRLEAAAAIGRQDAKESLPEDLQAREAPSERKPVSEFAFAGNFR